MEKLPKTQSSDNITGMNSNPYTAPGFPVRDWKATRGSPQSSYIQILLFQNFPPYFCLQAEDETTNPSHNQNSQAHTNHNEYQLFSPDPNNNSKDLKRKHRKGSESKASSAASSNSSISTPRSSGKVSFPLAEGLWVSQFSRTHFLNVSSYKYRIWGQMQGCTVQNLTKN